MVHQNMLLGQAGIHRVAAELLTRGVSVLVPTVDEGVDLFTGTGAGIQIKASHLTTSTGHGQSRYHFAFRYWSWTAGQKRQSYGRLNSKVTHVVLWGVNDDIFWIIPKPKLHHLASLNIGLHVKRTKVSIVQRYEPFQGAWHLLQKHEDPASRPGR